MILLNKASEWYRYIGPDLDPQAWLTANPADCESIVGSYDRQPAIRQKLAIGEMIKWKPEDLPLTGFHVRTRTTSLYSWLFPVHLIVFYVWHLCFLGCHLCHFLGRHLCNIFGCFLVICWLSSVASFWLSSVWVFLAVVCGIFLAVICVICLAVICVIFLTVICLLGCRLCHLFSCRLCHLFGCHLCHLFGCHLSHRFVLRCVIFLTVIRVIFMAVKCKKKFEMSVITGTDTVPKEQFS